MCDFLVTVCGDNTTLHGLWSCPYASCIGGKGNDINNLAIVADNLGDNNAFHEEKVGGMGDSRVRSS